MTELGRERYAANATRDPRFQISPKMGRASALGWELAILYTLFMGGGYYLDQRFGSSPWLLLLGVLLGTVATIPALVRAAKMSDDEENK